MPQGALGSLRVFALDGGSKSNGIAVEVTEAGGDEASEDVFKLVVRQHGEVKEEYDRATTGSGKQNVATLVNGTSTLIRVELATGAAEKPAVGTSATLLSPGPAAPALGRPFAAARGRGLRR